MYVTRFLHLSVSGIEPEEGAPAPERVVAGEPRGS